MNARDDYPILAEAALDGRLLCWTEAAAALDEIDRLRGEVERMTRAKRTLQFVDSLPDEDELGCRTCHGTSVVCVAGPDRYGNYDADDCPTCSAHT